ncbi:MULTISPECIES: arsenate reductase family protein [Bifidobacterium]|jgi:arsenate reductase|uniref:arsenate reductase family protein n=1 Tax=Bifidobacterium TaxID=1678 RepID=UPI00192A5160|nr:arsenate reductase family protein [Bifidobacterium tibiigranuli]MCI1211718.1 arsenate reductase family protein [Bifidobacterium tibiigranuli]MCI1221988.1 arsenate reductase family protein [Bifidobacterium tibiigranuli]MCI1233079.1 arsenate reductase family protein [Bifidobacterium tibiigranuli]MCI1254203.1 arsenate reductase family protein [Bifidobacterium tibiigranuli]
MTDHNADALLFVCYSRCSTCAKARRWLGEHDIAFTERDIKTDNPTKAELTAWYHASGLPIRRFFNTSGQIYRALGLKDKLPAMSDDEALELLATDGMLVKRPIVVTAHGILVGFAPEVWRTSLASTDDGIE